MRRSAALAALVAAAALGALATQAHVFVLAAIAAAGLTYLTVRSQRAAAITYLIVLASIPYWLPTSVGGISITAGGGVGAVIAVVLIARGQFRIERVELLLLGFLLLCIAATV